MAAARGAPRVELPGVRPLEPERRRRDESEDDFAYTLRLLGDYGFAFHDLGLSPSEAHEGPREIRRVLLSMSSALADAQPGALSRAVIATSGRAGANQILYEPPRSAAYVTLGTALEVGVNLLPLSWSQGWLKLNLALQVSRWQSLATPSRLTMAASPLLGPEVELFFLSTSVAQWMLGARAGWQASWADGAGFGRCGELQAFGDARNCSQLLLHGYLAVGLLERLRMQLVLETFPTAQAAEFRSRIAFQLGFGLQFF
jgi:hypothetical protein